MALQGLFNSSIGNTSLPFYNDLSMNMTMGSAVVLHPLNYVCSETEFCLPWGANNVVFQLAEQDAENKGKITQESILRACENIDLFVFSKSIEDIQRRAENIFPGLMYGMGLQPTVDYGKMKKTLKRELIFTLKNKGVEISEDLERKMGVLEEDDFPLDSSKQSNEPNEPPLPLTKPDEQPRVFHHLWQTVLNTGANLKDTATNSYHKLSDMYTGHSFLHKAALENNILIVQQAAAEDLYAQDNYGNFAIFYAVAYKDIAFLLEIEKRGTTLELDLNHVFNVKNHKGETALFEAARRDSLEAVKFLLNWIDPRVKNKKGEVAADYTKNAVILRELNQKAEMLLPVSQKLDVLNQKVDILLDTFREKLSELRGVISNLQATTSKLERKDLAGGHFWIWGQDPSRLSEKPATEPEVVEENVDEKKHKLT